MHAQRLGCASYVATDAGGATLPVPTLAGHVVAAQLATAPRGAVHVVLSSQCSVTSVLGVLLLSALHEPHDM